MPSHSDEYFKFVETSCIPEANYFKLSSEGIYNIGAYKRDSPVVVAIERQSPLNFVSGGDVFETTCMINKKVIGVELDYRKPRTKGECGAETRAALNVSIDGELIINNARFHSSCFSYTVSQIDFRDLIYGRFKVCGRYTNRSPYKKSDVCSNINLSSLKGESLDVGKLFEEVANEKSN